MTKIFDEPDDATILTIDEKKGLIPDFITTRADLNRVEQRNIIQAQRWAFSRQRDILDLALLRRLHRQMFSDVWKWAGTFRTTASNIGIEASSIGPQLHNLIEDTKVQIDYNSYPVDEIAARFHHRLVFIHPFPNGNGRHSRLATDMLARQLGVQPFQWGAHGDLVTPTETRKAYISALRALDAGDVSPLLAFLRP